MALLKNMKSHMGHQSPLFTSRKGGE